MYFNAKIFHPLKGAIFDEALIHHINGHLYQIGNKEGSNGVKLFFFVNRNANFVHKTLFFELMQCASNLWTLWTEKIICMVHHITIEL